MFNFFHNLGVGIISALIAFTGSFHSQPTSAVSTSTTPIITATATSTNEKSNNVFTPYQKPNNKQITTPTIKAPPVASPDTIAFGSKPLLAPATNFYNSLSALYTDKISFLDNQIASDTFGTYLVKGTIDEVNKFISDGEALQTKYGWANTATLNKIAVEHINFNKYEVEQMNIALSSFQDRIDALGQIKSRLEKEVSSMSSQSNISEGEYKLRTIELDGLVDKDKIKAQQTNIMDSIGALTTTDKNYDDLELKAAYEQKAQADADLASLKIQEANIVPVIPISSMITPTQTQPTSIHCETTYDPNSGNPSTTCTDMTTFQSMTCDSKYNNYGNPVKDCYSR